MSTRRIVIFVGDDYEDMELQYPKYRLIEAGFEVTNAGLEAAHTYHGKHGYPQKSDAAVADIDPAQFDGLVIPGGWMPDKLRRDQHVLRITKAINDAKKLVASICHGGWINISADIVRGINYTSTPGIKDDMINAGAQWVDKPLVVDGHHVSSRRPDDLPQFAKGMLDVLGGQ
jgi:protease I